MGECARLRICISAVSRYQHSVKAFAKVPAGIYIWCPSSKQATPSVWHNPYLTRAEADGAPVFEEV